MGSARSAENLRTVIVDDEEPARLVIREYLMSLPNITVIAECANGFDAVKVIGEQKPDLVFLDIQMPKLNGFEVLELLDDPPAIVFATAYDRFALKAFEVHAVDYLLKPFTRERLREAIERVRELMRTKSPIPVRALVSSARPSGTPLERLLVKSGSRVHVIPVEQIDYIEAQDDYIAIHTGGAKHLKQQRLSEVETEIDDTRYVRVHRSYILNIDRIARIELYAKDSRIAILNDGTKLPISRSGYEKLKKLL